MMDEIAISIGFWTLFVLLFIRTGILQNEVDKLEKRIEKLEEK